MKFESYNEIFNDTFCLEYLFEIKRTIEDIETKNIISHFIFSFMPILFTEIPVLLNKEGVLEKKSFYNPPYHNIAESKRHKILKTTIHRPYMNKIIEEMGIDFLKCVYDLNIVVSETELISLNYAMFKDIEEYDDYYWSSLAFLNADISNSILKGALVDIDCNTILQKLSEKIQNIKNDISANVNPIRYSYSTYKLFSKSSYLEKSDKLLILYRYELVKNIILLSHYIDDFTLDCKSNEQIVLRANFSSFMSKMKAIVIYIIGKDFLDLDTYFSQQIKEQLREANIDDNFYRQNGLLRNNLHYSEIQDFSYEQKNSITEKQDTYLKIIISNFTSVIDIDLDDEVLTMTVFTNECFKKGYDAEYLKQNYESLYLKFLNDGKL